VTAVPEASEADLSFDFTLAVPFALPHVSLNRRAIIRGEMKAGWYAYAGTKGQADLYAIVDGGQHVEIETKSLVGKLRAAQEAWRDNCRRRRIPYLILRPLPREAPSETVERWIEELRRVVIDGGR
jgi:hypothetical protein